MKIIFCLFHSTDDDPFKRKFIEIITRKTILIKIIMEAEKMSDNFYFQFAREKIHLF
jgi:hypothetical protein